MNFLLRLRIDFKKLFLVFLSLALNYTLIAHKFWAIVRSPCLIWKESFSFITFIAHFWFLWIKRHIILLNNGFIFLWNSFIRNSSGVDWWTHSLSCIHIMTERVINRDWRLIKIVRFQRGICLLKRMIYLWNNWLWRDRSPNWEGIRIGIDYIWLVQVRSIW